MAITGRVVATLPASDLARATDFYTNKVGLTSTQALPDGEGVLYDCASGTQVLVFPSSGAASGTHTQASFETDDLEAEVAAMKGRGVVFEDYDLPGFRTENSITVDMPFRSAFFKDTEGNLISVAEPVQL